MAIHVTPIPKLSDFATPSITIGPTAAAGTASTVIRSDSTIAGVSLITSVDETLARFNGTAGQLQGYTSNSPKATDAGIVILPGQPAFAAYLTAAQDNKTGDGTQYTIPFNATRLNQGTVFNTSTYTFTAPVTGQYLLASNVEFEGVTTSETGRILTFVVSNYSWSIRAVYTLAGNFSISGSVIADMDASDTATVFLQINSGSKVVDVLAESGTGRTFFSGCLIA